MAFLKWVEKAAVAAGIASEVPDASSDNKPVTATVTPTKSIVANTVIAPTVTTTDPKRSEELTNSAKDLLINAMKNDGAELVEEVEDSVDTLKDAISDESKLYAAVIKMMTKKGHSASALVSDFEKCLSTLDKVKNDFDLTQKKVLDSKISTNAQTISDLEKQIALKKEEIKSRESEIETMSFKINEEKANVTVEQTKINEVTSHFNNVFVNVRKTVSDRKDKLVKYSEGK